MAGRLKVNISKLNNITNFCLRILIISFLLCEITLSNVSALVPGDSDYKVADSVILADVIENEISLININTKVTVAIPKSAFSDTVTAVSFESTTVDSNTDVALIAAKTAENSGYSDAMLYDFKLLDQDGETIVKLNAKASVTVVCPDILDSVLYYNDKDYSVESMGGIVKSGFITFETDHFSYFMLAKKISSMNFKLDMSPEKGEDKSNNKTTNWIAVIGISLMVAGGVFMVAQVIISRGSPKKRD